MTDDIPRMADSGGKMDIVQIMVRYYEEEYLL
jgi:hypothetical protein